MRMVLVEFIWLDTLEMGMNAIGVAKVQVLERSTWISMKWLVSLDSSGFNLQTGLSVIDVFKV